MKGISFAFFFALASALPSRYPTSTVTLQLITSQTQHRHSLSESQHLLKQSTESMTLEVGQTLSLDHAPRRIHGITIVRVTQGQDLSTPAVSIAEDDYRVRCRARIGYESQGWVFGLEDRTIGADLEESIEMTAVECWVEGDDDKNWMGAWH